MLQERNTRVGFFEPEQLESVLAHLPEEIQPVIDFAAITGWRIASEVSPLEWRQVDMTAGEVRLDAHTTKNGEGRVFPFTADLRALLKARVTERDRLKKAGHLCPFVFFREAPTDVAAKRSRGQSPASPRRGNQPVAQRGVPAGSRTTCGAQQSVPSSAPAFQSASRCSSPGIRRGRCSSATTS
jgi:integrase